MTIRDRRAAVLARIAAAAEAAGRSAADVTLVAVAKLHPAAAIRAAYDAGQRHFGESYVQELLAKQEALGDLPDLRWHLIGHLQRNKVRRVVGRVALIETVDSAPLAEEISKRAVAAGVEVHVLLQVKLGGEATKTGCPPESLPALVDVARALPGLRPTGLMVIPPFDLDETATRHAFRTLRELRDGLPAPERLPHLSMGMSHDFEEAVAQGATLVRVGTAIFGERRG